MHAMQSLRTLLAVLPGRLTAIAPDSAAAKSEGGWSAKEELGHLVDSAANNHQRIVRAQLEENPAMPGYDGPMLVGLHAYQNRDWNEVIVMWEQLNRLLLAAAEAVPDGGWSRTCTIAGSKPLTLQFVLEDYMHH